MHVPEPFDTDRGSSPGGMKPGGGDEGLALVRAARGMDGETFMLWKH